MKARVLRVKPLPAIALEPEDEGDRRVMEAIVRGESLRVGCQTRGEGLRLEQVDLQATPTSATHLAELEAQVARAQGCPTCRDGKTCPATGSYPSLCSLWRAETPKEAADAR